MKLTLHGAAEGVTGSCYLLETSKGKVLVDCGMFQGDWRIAKKKNPVLDFDPSEIDAVVVTHAHLDHTGRLPLLVKRGFSGPIYSTPPTRDLAMLVVEDAARLQQDKFETYGDEVLYTEDDVIPVQAAWQGRTYETQFELIPGVMATLHQAGHILGSAFISLEIAASETVAGKKMRFVFSGDIGNDNVPILPSTSPINDADVIVLESTYGDKDHEPAVSRKGSLVSAVTKVVNRGGTLIIPAFSIERTQELLYALDELVDSSMIPSVPIFLDSPLAIRSTAVYRKFTDYLEFDRDVSTSPDHDFFTFPKLVETLSVDASKEINAHEGPKIIISGSGMMNGGRVQHHLKRYLSDPKSGVLIIGFQAPGTLGRKIQDGQSPVKMLFDEIEVKASIMSLDSFSAHGDRQKLFNWIHSADGLQQVLLTHGDPDTKVVFKEFLKQKGFKQDIDIPAFKKTMEY